MAFCNWGNVIVTFAASTFVFVIWWVTAFASPDCCVPAGLVGEPPKVCKFPLGSISTPVIAPWVAVPTRVCNSTLWKLKSEGIGCNEFAVDFKTGVSLKNISLRLAIL